jgi:hypothetical protein
LRFNSGGCAPSRAFREGATMNAASIGFCRTPQTFEPPLSEAGRGWCRHRAKTAPLSRSTGKTESDV